MMTILAIVRFPWVVATESLGKTHSIETGRDLPGIVFTSHIKVKSLLCRAGLLGVVLVEKVAQLLGTVRTRHSINVSY